MNPMRRLLAGIATMAAVVLFSIPADAQIVAIGSSQTSGQGVGAGAAWPAQLQAMLAAKGYNVQISNAGVNGDDSNDVRAWLSSAVPDGTKLVIIQAPGPRDKERGINTNANVAAMVASMRARGIKTITTSNIQSWAGGQLQPDGQHPSAGGHASIAAHLVPQVVAALGKK